MSRDYHADELRDIGQSEESVQATMLEQLWQEQKRAADALERIADTMEREETISYSEDPIIDRQLGQMYCSLCEEHTEHTIEEGDPICENHEDH